MAKRRRKGSNASFSSASPTGGREGRAAEERPKDLVLGRFEVGKVLGQGGFCLVREGRDASGVAVAVKTFNDQLTRKWSPREVEDRFRKEIATFEEFRSWRLAGVVELLAYGRSGKDFTTVLELGAYTLEEALKQSCRGKKKGLSTAAKASALHALCAALSGLHSRDRVHTDVKPANVMWFASSGEWKLIDLDGVAIANEELPLDPPFWTPQYCAPEVAKAVLDGQSRFAVHWSLDSWAAGVCVLDVLANGGAFDELKASLVTVDIFDDEWDVRAGDEKHWMEWLASPNSVPRWRAGCKSCSKTDRISSELRC
jgi:serine/threonine protein kinase